jgi:hypothetical protein
MAGADPIKCLAFKNDVHGFAFGREGLIWETTNGGITWSMEQAEYSPGVDMGAFFDATWKGDLLMAVGGDGGMVIRQDEPLLPQPTLLIPSYLNPVAKSFKAVWKRSEGAERYQLRLITNSWPKDTLIIEDNLVDTTYDISNLIDHSYFLEVRALSSNNQSNWSKVHFATNGPASVEVKSRSAKLTLAPNPSREREVSIYGLTRQVQVELTDILGVRRSLTSLDAAHNQLELHGLPAGAYTVTVYDGESIESMKLMLK